MNPFRSFWQWLSGLARAGAGGSEFLCDTCLYNYGDACTRPERPNATRCPDYKKK